MEVESSSNLPNENQNSGALDVSLHPLVIVNISDHYTRSKVRKGDKRVFGCLLGKQMGRKVEIFNSFELVCKDESKFDLEFLEERTAAYKQVFPDLEIMGWYSNGNAIRPNDIHLQKQMESYNESSLYLLLDTDPDIHVNEIPINIYESQLKVVNDEPTTIFVKIEYKIESGDAERLAVDHIARFSSSSTSVLHLHLQSMCNSIKMLKLRLDAIIKFLKHCQDENKKVDPSIMRRVGSLCQMLPSWMEVEAFKQQFLVEYNDSLLVTYLSTILKASNVTNDLIDKFSVAFGKKSVSKIVH